MDETGFTWLKIHRWLQHSGTSCNVENGITAGRFSTSLHFDLNDLNDKEVPVQVISLPLPGGLENLLVTAISRDIFL